MVAPVNTHRCVLRRVLTYQPLEIFEPRPGRQAEFKEAVLPDIHMPFFLERETEAWNVVVEQYGAHAKAFFVEQNPVLQRDGLERLAPEARAAAKSRAGQGLGGAQFGRGGRGVCRVGVDQV